MAGFPTSLRLTPGASMAEEWLKTQPEGWNRNYEVSQFIVERARARGYEPPVTAICEDCEEKEGRYAVTEGARRKLVCMNCRVNYNGEGYRHGK